METDDGSQKANTNGGHHDSLATLTLIESHNRAISICEIEASYAKVICLDISKR